jgi:branched-chain amino acid transport system ATP-binding protein
MFFEIKDLWCHYGGAEVLKGISLKVEEGETVTIIGSNGAGKTTILRTISGLKILSSGQISFKGKRVGGKLAQDIVKMGIIHVPEERALFPYMTVLENLKLGAYLEKDRKQIDTRLENVYEHFPILKNRERQRAKTLSGGEQQMLAIGRALMGNPKLILLDEPSLGLSPMNVMEIARIIVSIKEIGISVILVEQNARLALKSADRAYLLETGNIVLDGKADELMYSEHVKRAYLGEE